MTGKSAYYALAVVLLMGSMAGVALADNVETNWMYGPADSSVSSQPEQGVEQPNAGEIREPMETGEVPDRSVDSSDLHSNASVDEPTVEIGGQSYRPSIDFP
jgi:hypothetical protein